MEWGINSQKMRATKFCLHNEDKKRGAVLMYFLIRSIHSLYYFQGFGVGLLSSVGAW